MVSFWIIHRSVLTESRLALTAWLSYLFLQYVRLGLVCPKPQDAEGVWTSGFLRYKSMLFGLLWAITPNPLHYRRGIVCDGYNKSGCMYCKCNFMMRHYFPKLTYLHFPIRVKYVFFIHSKNAWFQVDVDHIHIHHIFHWIGHDVISGSRSRSALEYWFSNTFTAFCFLWLFWYWWPAGRVYISRGFKGPRETLLSKPNIFAGLLFTRVRREIQASDLGKPQGESKLVFMITCTLLWWLESSVAVEFFPAGFLSSRFVLASCGWELHFRRW